MEPTNGTLAQINRITILGKLLLKVLGSAVAACHRLIGYSVDPSHTRVARVEVPHTPDAQGRGGHQAETRSENTSRSERAPATSSVSAAELVRTIHESATAAHQQNAAAIGRTNQQHDAAPSSIHSHHHHHQHQSSLANQTVVTSSSPSPAAASTLHSAEHQAAKPAATATQATASAPETAQKPTTTETAKPQQTTESAANLPTAAQQKAAAMLCGMDPQHTTPSDDARVRDIRNTQLDRCKDFQTVSTEAGKLNDVIDNLKKNLGQQEQLTPMGDQLAKLKADLLQHLEHHQKFQAGLSQTRDDLMASIQKLNEGMSFEKMGRDMELRHLPEKAQELYNKAHASLVQANEILHHNPLTGLLPGTHLQNQLHGTSQNGVPLNGSQLATQGKPLSQLLSPENAASIAATAVLATTQPGHWLNPTTIGAPAIGLVNGMALSNLVGTAGVVTAHDRAIDTASRTPVPEQHIPSAVAATAAATALFATATTLASQDQQSFAGRAIHQSNLHNTREQAIQSASVAEQVARAEAQAATRQAHIAIQQANRRSAVAAATAGAQHAAKAVAKKSILELMNSRATKNKVIGGAMAGALTAVGIAAVATAPAITATALSSSTLALFGGVAGAAGGTAEGFHLGGAGIAVIGAALGALFGTGLGSQIKSNNSKLKRR